MGFYPGEILQRAFGSTLFPGDWLVYMKLPHHFLFKMTTNRKWQRRCRISHHKKDETMAFFMASTRIFWRPEEGTLRRTKTLWRKWVALRWHGGAGDFIAASKVSDSVFFRSRTNIYSEDSKGVKVLTSVYSPHGPGVLKNLRGVQMLPFTCISL